MQNEKPKETESEGTGTRVAGVGAKALDIALGMASLTVEAAEFATRYLIEKGPEWVAELEERGRPVREQLTDAAKVYSKPLPVETGGEEISALERRIRELEAEVTTSPTAPPPPLYPDLPVTPEPPAVPPVGVGVDADDEPVTSGESQPRPLLTPFVAPDIDDEDDDTEGTQNTGEGRPESV